MIRLDAFHVLTVSMLLPCLSTSCCGSQEAVLLTADFESDPLASGWIFDGDNAKATWVDQGRNGGKCISLAEGFWESAPIPVTPYQYYKVTFHSKAEGRGYWAAINYNADGKALDADHHSGVDRSEDWLETTYCTRAKADAASIRFRFQPREEKRLTVDDVKVETVSRGDVAKWADEVYATIPPVNIQPPENRWQSLPRTMQKLREGGTIRVVMLGDSIMNDTGNSPFDVLLERLYPRAHIEVVTSVRGGTGTSYYKGENLVKQYVLDYNPDFLIIGGISNGRAEATRSVIQQVRAVIDPEIMVTTGAVCTGMDPTTNENWTYEVDPDGKGYRSEVQTMAGEERVQYYDMTGPWGRYIAESGKPLSWFQRDVTHANVRGAAVLARLLEAYFAPVDK